MNERLIVGVAIGDCVHVAGVVNFLNLAEQLGYRTVCLGPAVSVEDLLAKVAALAPALSLHSVDRLPTRLSNRSRSALPVPPLAGQSTDPGRGNGANGAPGSLVTSIYRTAHRDHPPGILGSSVLLDCR